jgi:hypothetical protein
MNLSRVDAGIPVPISICQNYDSRGGKGESPINHDRGVWARWWCAGGNSEHLGSWGVTQQKSTGTRISWGWHTADGYIEAVHRVESSGCQHEIEETSLQCNNNNSGYDNTSALAQIIKRSSSSSSSSLHALQCELLRSTCILLQLRIVSCSTAFVVG